MKLNYYYFSISLKTQSKNQSVAIVFVNYVKNAVKMLVSFNLMRIEGTYTIFEQSILCHFTSDSSFVAFFN